MNIKKSKLNSPIRWAGSKKRLLNDMLSLFVPEKENYVEPFLGSGIVLINVLDNNAQLRYKNFYVNDINKNIISLYNMLKNDFEYLISEVNKLFDLYNDSSFKSKENMYYRIRAEFNETFDERLKTVYFFFLMKSGFNGVYRENKKGNFNVPFGKKDFLTLDCTNLRRISELIQNVIFYNLEFEEFMFKLKEQGILNNAFVYCDPPYLPDDDSINKKQELYTSISFDHVGFVDTINSFKLFSFMISMSDSKMSESIYVEHGKLQKRNISSILRIINPKRKFESKEIIFTNYDIYDNEDY